MPMRGRLFAPTQSQLGEKSTPSFRPTEASGGIPTSVLIVAEIPGDAFRYAPAARPGMTWIGFSATR
jgi:hypothetical protein